MRTYNELIRAIPTPIKYDTATYKEEDIKILTELYDGQPIFIERLPYTDMFNAIVNELTRRTGRLWDHSTVYNLLLVLRKRGKLLPKK